MLGQAAEEGQAAIPSITTGPPFHFPESSLVYFQFVFAAITPILMLGSVLGRINFKAWIPFVLLWITFVYTVNAFLIWGGGYFAFHGALDYSGGYVIHLAAGISGFVAAAVIGPRLQRDREVDAPNNLLMVAAGAGLLWLGWNGFNGGDSYYAGANASAAVLNTNLCTAVAMLVWIAWDYIFRDKPSLIGSVNGMITGLVAITPAAGFVNGYGAIVIGVVASTIVWMAIRFLSRAPMFRSVDDTLGVIYTHGIAGLTGGLLVGVLADPHVIEYIGVSGGATDLPGFAGVVHGSWTLLRWQAETAAWVIVFSGVATFILLKLVGIFVPAAPLRRGARDRRSRDPRQRGVPLGCAHAWGSARPGVAAKPGGSGAGGGCRIGRDATSVCYLLGARSTQDGTAAPLRRGRGVSSSAGAGETHGAGDAGAPEAAVAAGVLGEVLLVVVPRRSRTGGRGVHRPLRL